MGPLRWQQSKTVTISHADVVLVPKLADDIYASTHAMLKGQCLAEGTTTNHPSVQFLPHPERYSERVISFTSKFRDKHVRTVSLIESVCAQPNSKWLLAENVPNSDGSKLANRKVVHVTLGCSDETVIDVGVKKPSKGKRKAVLYWGDWVRTVARARPAKVS
jgi:hypothetical protein